MIIPQARQMTGYLFLVLLIGLCSIPVYGGANEADTALRQAAAALLDRMAGTPGRVVCAAVNGEMMPGTELAYHSRGNWFRGNHNPLKRQSNISRVDTTR